MSGLTTFTPEIQEDAMKRSLLVLSAALVTAASSPAFAALPVGAAAPNFSATAYQAGNPVAFDLKTALKKGPVVLYFFPAAYTGGCNIEAQEFARSIDDFKAAGATVIGVTGGNTDRLADFSKEHCAGQFPVAAAPAATIKAYDVAMPAKAEMSNRTSYVIGKNGKIAGVHSEMSPVGHIAATLAVLRASKSR
jgi:peroxiredoxin